MCPTVHVHIAFKWGYGDILTISAHILGDIHRRSRYGRAMPTPDFVLKLREQVGHNVLWLAGITAVVFDDEDRVLLVRRSDNGRWTLVTGILEPGEPPSAGAMREVFEKTGVEVSIDCFAGVNR
jgi:hypothetical protein